jgi:myxalamid-type nonribosomal peptide synthetase MxaA
LRRIRNSLHKFLLWDDKYAERVVPLIGSLELPLLGLQESQVKNLIANLDSIYHCGATVNHIQVKLYF